MQLLADPADTPTAIGKPTKAHMAAASLHLSGMSAHEIAYTIGKSPIWVISTLKDPIIRVLLDKFLGFIGAEVQALVPLSLETLRVILRNGDASNQMKAIELVMRMNNLSRPEKSENEGLTAEDVIARMLSVMEKQATALAGATESQQRFSTVLDIEPSAVQKLNTSTTSMS